MRSFRSAFVRLARAFSPDRQITLRFRTDSRTAAYVLPLVEKLLDQGDDGEAYCHALGHWHHSERPPLYFHCGTFSQCRIEGPLQEAPPGYPGDSVPMGGLILTPGATVHLSPFEADDIQNHIEKALEAAIVAWCRKHRVYDLPPTPAAIERYFADREAKAAIANWTPEGFHDEGEALEDREADHG